MSDTSANQASYPQHSNQLVGCGFPLAKVVVWFCVTTGAVLEVAMAAFTTSEWKLARQLYATLKRRCRGGFCLTYVDLALVRSVNADGVFRKHHARHCFFVAARSWGLAIILSSGSVLSSALNP